MIQIQDRLLEQRQDGGAVLRPLWRSIDQWCLERLARAFDGAPIRLEIWTGSAVALSASAPLGSLFIRDRATLLRLVTRPPELAFGEAYAAGRLTVVGDLTRILEGLNRALAQR